MPHGRGLRVIVGRHTPNEGESKGEIARSVLLAVLDVKQSLSFKLKCVVAVFRNGRGVLKISHRGWPAKFSIDPGQGAPYGAHQYEQSIHESTIMRLGYRSAGTLIVTGSEVSYANRYMLRTVGIIDAPVVMRAIRYSRSGWVRFCLRPSIVS